MVLLEINGCNYKTKQYRIFMINIEAKNSKYYSIW